MIAVQMGLGVFMVPKHSRDRLNRWLYMMLPYEIAYAPVSNLVILYILSLGGTVIDASYAVAFSNLLMIAASVFWGKLVEFHNRRKVFIVISLLGLSVSLVGLSLVRSVFWVIMIYGTMTFLVIANTTPFNMLVMETNPRDKWAQGFSKLQMLSSVGVVLSYVITASISGFLSIGSMMLVLFPFAVVALIFTKYIQEPSAVFPKLALFRSVNAFRSRLISNPLLFLFNRRTRTRTGKLSPSRYPVRGPWLHTGDYTAVLYASTLVFYVGSTIFNTSYPAGLKSYGLSNFDVLSVILIGSVVQTITFYKSGILTSRRVKSELATSSLFIRGLGYMAIGVTFLTISNLALLGANIVLYAIVAGLAYALFYTAFNTMVFEAVGNERRGSKLGIYSGFVGLGSLIGAPIAGYASYFIGYWFAFILSGALIVVTSVIIILGIRHADDVARGHPSLPSTAR